MIQPFPVVVKYLRQLAINESYKSMELKGALRLTVVPVDIKLRFENAVLDVLISRYFHYRKLIILIDEKNSRKQHVIPLC